MVNPLDAEQLRQRVQVCIDAELLHQRSVLAELGPDVTDLVDVIGSLLQGGKRLRAAFLYWGYRAAGRPDSDAAVRMASAMEFFQGAALIHDDVMDDSDTRRGMPAAHRALAAHHDERGWDGNADRFGLAGAILAGNLCLNWTEELFSTSGLPDPAIAAARPAFDRMRTQLMAGQFLDVIESVRPWANVDPEERLARSSRVIRYKSAKYTIEHPLLIGASAGGLGGETLAGLSDYGLELGHAFQLRDDLLGVFGDPEETGKPAGDDLREGKRTMLIAHALTGSSAAAQQRLETLLGRPDLTADQVADLRDIITASGAVDTVEADIAARAGRARRSLDQVHLPEGPAPQVLAELIETATARTS